MLRIRLLLLFCVIVWGSTFVATKMCLAHMTPFELLGLRFLIGLPLLAAIIAVKKIRLEFTRSDVRVVGFGSFLIAVHFIIQNVALLYTSATSTGWIIAVTPLAIATLSHFILRERIAPREIAGIAVATFGVALLMYNGSLENFGWLESIGDWLVLLSTFTWALYTIATRNLAHRRHPLTIAFIMFAPLTIISLTYMAYASNATLLSTMPVDVLIALLFLGVLGTITQWFWQEGIAKLGAAKAGIFLYLEPIATTTLAIPLLGEYLTPYVTAGGMLVIAGVWWAQREKAA